MTCEEFLTLLDEDGLEDSPDAAAHAEACASCRAALERWRVVRHEFTAMRDEPAPPFLHTRVMAHVQGAPPEGRNWFGWLTGFRPTWATTALVLVLGMAIGGLGVWRWRPSPGGSAPPPVPRERSVRKAQATAPRVEPDRTPAGEPAPPPSRFPALDQLPTRQAPEGVERRKKETSEEEATGARLEAKGEIQPGPSSAPGAPAAGQAAKAPIFQGAANDAGPEGTAVPAPEPAVRDAAPAPRADESSLVVCTLKSLDQGGLIVLQIPLEAAPPPSGGWSVLVGGDGSMTVLDASGARMTRPHPELISILATQRLSPGRYLLKRVG